MQWILADWPAPKCVHALTTLRQEGVSQAPYDSFNLGLHVQDDETSVLKNRHLLVESLQLPEAPRWLTQHHSTTLLLGDDVYDAPLADASYTRTPGVVLAVMTADCLPILLCHQDGSMVAAIHAGWRGLLDGIIAKSFAALAIPSDECLIWLGPAISVNAYEIGAEVREAFLASGDFHSAFQQRQDKWFLNLYAIARQQLQNLGVTQIYGGDYCTLADSQRFFSYRRDGVTGRMASLIWLNK